MCCTAAGPERWHRVLKSLLFGNVTKLRTLKPVSMNKHGTDGHYHSNARAALYTDGILPGKQYLI